MNTLAIDIGGTKFSLALFEGERITLRESHLTNRDGGRTWMMEQILPIAKRWQAQAGFGRCGIGFGGPVDFNTQLTTVSNMVADWQQFPLSRWLEDELGVPTIMDNDANVGALGEARYGAGVGCDPLVYLTISTGIGGGVVAGGKIFRGADSYAAEIGHMTVRPGGARCLCGSEGCMERICCGTWIEADNRRPAKDLLADPEFVERYVVDLAVGLRNVIMLLNPARIVIGGGISKAGDALFVPLRAELKRTMAGWPGTRIDVTQAALGDDSVLFGALALAEDAAE